MMQQTTGTTTSSSTTTSSTGNVSKPMRQHELQHQYMQPYTSRQQMYTTQNNTNTNNAHKRQEDNWPQQTGNDNSFNKHGMTSNQQQQPSGLDVYRTNQGYGLPHHFPTTNQRLQD